ncbi:hypothetical protein EG329_005867 [Mollisiaceae sp. DMI_Dod_QoI]|nr:hypothetical protein EG329_005867 [Helotiales sp. DMI_Dod_QoI]
MIVSRRTKKTRKSGGAAGIIYAPPKDIPDWIWNIQAIWTSSAAFQGFRDSFSSLDLQTRFSRAFPKTGIIPYFDTTYRARVKGLHLSHEPVLPSQQYLSQGNYQYSPIPLDSIRLLHLEPGTRDRPISCSLVVCAVDELPSFEALSYTWGDTSVTNTISCHGLSLNVHSNAWHALLDLRQDDAPRILWIDAICINQEDDAERSAQVQLMRHIYARANQVLVWMQPVTDDMELVFSTLSRLSRLQATEDSTDRLTSFTATDLKSRGLPDAENQVWNALDTLLWSPWFSRIWIIQEISLAREALVVSGSVTCPWEDVKGAAHFISDHSLTAIIDVDPSQILRLGSMAETFRDGGSILELAQLARASKATDPKDKIFGLLGLASDGQDLAPDYSVKPQESYTTLTLQLIEKQQSLAVLNAVEHWGDYAAGQQVFQRLPSWVPNWTLSPLTQPLPEKAQLEQSALTYKLLPEHSQLQVQGLELGTIKDAGDTFLEFIPWVGNSVPEVPAIQWATESLQMKRWRQWNRMANKVSVYPTGEAVQSAYIRTLVADSLPQEPDRDSSLESIYNSWLRFWRIAGLQRGRFLDYWNSNTSPEEAQSAITFMAAHKTAAYGRRFFVTREGYFGLGPFQAQGIASMTPREVVGLFPTEVNSIQDANIDIIAVHGLGGDYQRTWTSGNVNWLRDFLPDQLRSEGIKPRIMCYGYDANTAFSKNVTGIHNVAEDLLDRLRTSRRREKCEQRPIIFIAHSLGGLIVKKASQPSPSVQSVSILTIIDPSSISDTVMISADMPVPTTHFHGREAELEEMTRCLRPGFHDRRAVVLSGLGSFGKTQLARQFQLLNSRHYTSQIWIRIDALRKLDESPPAYKIILNIDEYKRDNGSSRLVLMPPSNFPFHHIKARLESPENQGWLLVVDDIEHLSENYNISDFLPTCEHGTIIGLTSRKNLRLSTLLNAKDIVIGGLGIEAATDMFLARFSEEYPTTSISTEIRDLAKTLASNLDGSPLAIEQASADLCSQGPPSVKTLTRYMQHLELEYTQLMENEITAEDCFYDKDNKSIISTFNLLEEAIKRKNANALKLLRLCSVIEDQDIGVQIPLNLQFSQNPVIFDWMAKLDEETIVKALMALHKFCCIELRFVSDGISSISVQRPIIRWCNGKLTRPEMDEWVLLAGYKIGQGLNIHAVAILERGYAPFVRTADESLYQKNIRQDLRPNPGDMSYWYELSAMVQFAGFYYRQKLFAEALRAIQRAQKLELLLIAESERHSVPALKRYHLLGLILRDFGELTSACDIFASLLSICKDVLGSDDAFTMTVASQSTALWNRRNHGDRMLEQVQQSRGVKTHIWAPEQPPDVLDYPPGLIGDYHGHLIDTMYIYPDPEFPDIGLTTIYIYE